MAALVFFHWLESVEDLMVVLTRSRMDLLMTPMLFLAGLISLHSTLLGKESLWSFIVIKASSSVGMSILSLRSYVRGFLGHLIHVAPGGLSIVPRYVVLWLFVAFVHTHLLHVGGLVRLHNHTVRPEDLCLVRPHLFLELVYIYLNLGNNWGWCEDGSGGLGCGPQETFR